MSNAVYMLYPIVDDPRYAGFGVSNMPDPIPLRITSRDWRPRSLASEWAPLEARGRVREFNDFPCINLGYPAFSERAVDALRELLEPNGELLKLRTTTRTPYYFYNLLTVADVLDHTNSEVEWGEGGKQRVLPFRVHHFQFHRDRLAGLSIFYIVEECASCFVTQPFVDRCKEHALKGFNFVKVWPVPRGTVWDPWERAKLAARGELPPEPDLKCQSVVVCLKLATGRRASKAERQLVNTYLDQVDAILAGDGDRPDVGALEGHEFSSGEARLFFSCPDADALGEALRPWLQRLGWPTGYYAIKRYGPYTDAEAREEMLLSIGV